MSAYDEALEALPVAQGGQEQGIVPILLRLATHLGYFIAHVTDKPASEEDTRATSDEEDLNAMSDHVTHLNFTATTLSTTANGNLRRIGRLVGTIGTDWTTLSDTQRLDRLTDVANRLAYVGAFLDVELGGIPSSPGGHV